MEQPPQTPDLNPIELLWDEFDRNVRKMHPTNQKHLWVSIQTSWNQISTKSLQKLIVRMHRVRMNVQSKGAQSMCCCYKSERKIL